MALAGTILWVAPSGAFAAGTPEATLEQNSVALAVSPAMTTVANAHGDDISTQKLAATLEGVFTKAIILDDFGVVSIDQNELRSILGDKEASNVIDQLSATQ